MSVGIVTKMQFVSPKGKDYQKYIDYIDRDETKAYISKKDFQQYTDYMGNPDKSTGVFNQEKDNLGKKELLNVKEQFTNAQQDASPLWQLVYSFDNDFLRQENLLSEEGLLNEAKVREAIRQSVEALKENEKMNDTLVWTGAIHYNTDNIHIHVALAEEQSSRNFQTFQNKNGKEFTARKGKFEKNTLWKAKSTFANAMIDRTQELTYISQLMRGELNQKIRTTEIKKDKFIFQQCEALMKQLPEDLTLWKYNMNAMKPYRTELNNLSRQLMEQYYPEAFQELKKAIQTEATFREQLYGSSKSGREFAQGKWNDLYAMIGNGVLKQLRDLKKEERKQEAFKQYKEKTGAGNPSTALTSAGQARVAFVRGLKQLGRKTKQEFLTQLKLEREAFIKELNKEREEQQLEFEMERGL